MHMKRRRHINFSLDKDERNTYKEKCRIINEALFGKNRFDWLTPDGLVRQLKSYERVLEDKEARYNCKHLLDVLGYFQKKESSDWAICPPTLAVYDYALDLAEYIRSMRGEAMAASSVGFSIRELKRRLWNFATDEQKSDEELLTEKCRIINQNLFGKDEDKWKNPKELAKFLTYSFPKIEDNEEAKNHCIQLINVITYYVARTEGRSVRRPDSVEVYESSEKLASALNPKPEPEPEPEPPKEEPKKEYNEKATKEISSRFYYSRRKDMADVVKSALEDGADPNHLDSYKQSFLLLEVFRKCRGKEDKKDRLEVIKALLDNGADPNILRHDGVGPLFVATERNDLDVVKLLLEHGADTEVKTDRGRTPIVVALERGYNEVADYLSNKGASVDVKSPRGSSTLALTIKSCNADGAKSLVEKGADVNAKDNMGCSPLMWAVANGDLDTVKYFVSKGADVDSAEEDGYTPLMWAILSDDTEIAKFLLDNGADPNKRPEDTLTPLMRAVENDNAQIVKALLKHGVKADETVDVLEHRTCHRNSGWDYPGYIKRTAMDYAKSEQVKDLLKGKDIADKDLKQGEKFNTLKAVLKKSKETGKPVHTICNAIAKKTLVPRVWELAREHNIPIRKVVVQPKAQRTKLGHCVSNTKEISMNVATTLFPQEIRDHIILHELSHIDNPHHRASFWKQCNELDKFTPEHDQEIDTWSKRVMRFFPR